MRRGSSTRILPVAHGSPFSTSGTRVVLPAPGGATSTATFDDCSAAVSAGRASSMGRAESKSISSVMPGLVPGIPLRRAPMPINRDGRDKPGHDV
jgi:hypothetical protein